MQILKTRSDQYNRQGPEMYQLAKDTELESLSFINCAKTQLVQKGLSCLLMAIPQILAVIADLKQPAANLTRIRQKTFDPRVDPRSSYY